MKTNQIAFYSTILAYLKSDVEVDELIPAILKLAKKSSLSWEATEEEIRKLEQCVNRQSEEEDDEEWSATKNDFIKSAFKDLSVLKNPEAMELFDRLLVKVCLKTTYARNEDLLIWAKSVKERPGGSAVIVLHVSDLERFRRIIENHDFVDDSTECNTLEECIGIGS